MKQYPPDTIIGMYQQLQEPTETAASYDFWAGLWLISTACGRYIYVDRPHARVYLNMYMILVANSGVTRKSTSVVKATSLVRACLEDDYSMQFIEGSTNTEGLQRVLGEMSMSEENAQVIISVDELATVLGTEAHKRSLPVTLTDLYDCPSHKLIPANTKRPAYNIRNIWLSFFSASTPAWLVKAVNPSVMEGGFTSRCYFILGDKPKQQVAWPEKRDTEELLKHIMIKWKEIRQQAKYRQTIGITDKAKEHFSQWYRRRRHSTDSFRNSFESREDAHVLRIASLLCINDNSWIIQQPHVREAISLINEVKEQGASLFEPINEKTDYLLAGDMIRRRLAESGDEAVSRAELFKLVRRRLRNDEFNALIETLHEMGLIQRFYTKGLLKKAGRPTELIRATTAFMAPSALEELHRRIEI